MNEPESPDDVATIIQNLDAIALNVEALAREIQTLKVLQEYSDQFHMGLLRAQLSTAYFYWLRVAEVSPVTAHLSEAERARKAATVTVDHILEHFPDDTKRLLLTKRDAMIDNLIDSVGHLPEIH